MKTLNIVLASAFALLAVFFFIASMQFKTAMQLEMLTSGSVPKVISVLLFLCAAAWIVLAIVSKDPTHTETFQLLSQRNILVASTFSIVVLYVLLMQLTNFYIATFAFLTCLMFVYKPLKSFRHVLNIILIAVCLDATIYLLFSKLLRVYLP